jgi:hypothetical protein
MRPQLYWLLAFVSIAFFLSCKKDFTSEKAQLNRKSINDSYHKGGTGSKTLRTIFFKEPLVPEQAILDESEKGFLKRYLIPLKNPEEANGVNRYQLIETGLTGKILNTCYIISRQPLKKDLDLFRFSIKKDTILFYEHTLYPNVRGGNGPVKEQLSVKIGSKYFNSNTEISRAPLPCDGVTGTTTCMDWYWIVYNADTGEIISVSYLYTTCSNECNDTGGGGGGGDGDGPPASGPIYICISSFNFQPQGSGSITNVSKTWE